MPHNYLDTIRQAAQQTKVLRIIYTEKDGTSEGWRYVEPYSFSDDKGDQALFAWDIEKDGIRRFILTRISQIEITNKNFSPRYPIKIQ